MEPLFREVQSFRQPWLWVILVIPLLSLLPLFGLGLHQQLVLGRPFGDSPMSDGGLIAVSAGVVGLVCALLLLFRFARLETTVEPGSVVIRFIPFHRHPRRFSVMDIASHQVRTYRPLVEYGGWGIRYGFGGMAYNVSGDRGVQLTLRNGKRVLIGSQRPEELDAALGRA